MKSPLYPKALSIIERLREAGHQAYLVGGCVRDHLLGIESPDLDIATSATPEEVQALFRRTAAVGAHFGVVLVMAGDDAFEVATFRADDRYVDGRRPVAVRFVSAEEDVLRRDFTINGLLYDVRDGRVVDHVGGEADLRARVLRTIGDPAARFSEDKLRLLRAIRFAARFTLTIEPGTLAALRDQAPTVVQVSSERIRDELFKMLRHEHPDAALRLLRETGLLRAVLPEVEAMKGVRQPEAFHPEGDVFDHTLLALRIMDQSSPGPRSDTLALSVLLHDVGKPGTYYEARDRIRFHNHPLLGRRIALDILRRLRAPGELMERVADCVENHMNFMHAREMRANTLKRLIRRPTFRDELELHRIDCLASHGGLENFDFLTGKEREFGAEKIAPPPLLTGRRLIEMGYRPGPLFKKILTEVEDQQLLEKIKTETEAEALVRERFPLN